MPGLPTLHGCPGCAASTSRFACALQTRASACWRGPTRAARRSPWALAAGQGAPAATAHACMGMDGAARAAAQRSAMTARIFRHGRCRMRRNTSLLTAISLAGRGAAVAAAQAHSPERLPCWRKLSCTRLPRQVHPRNVRRFTRYEHAPRGAARGNGRPAPIQRSMPPPREGCARPAAARRPGPCRPALLPPSQAGRPQTRACAERPCR